MREESLCFIFVSSKDSIYNYPDHLLLPPDSLIAFVKDCVGSSLSHVQDPQVDIAHLLTFYLILHRDFSALPHSLLKYTNYLLRSLSSQGTLDRVHVNLASSTLTDT